jgi:hypothetical protein
MRFEKGVIMSWDKVDYSTFESKPNNVVTIHYVTQEKVKRLVKESYIKALNDVKESIHINEDSCEYSYGGICKILDELKVNIEKESNNG